MPWGVPILVPGRRPRLAATASPPWPSSPAARCGSSVTTVPPSRARSGDGTEPAKFCRYLELVEHRGPGSPQAPDLPPSIPRTGGRPDRPGARGAAGGRLQAPDQPDEGRDQGRQPADPTSGRPVVLTVDHHRLRTNHTALIEASELPWRGGLDFELRLLVIRDPGRASRTS